MNVAVLKYSLIVLGLILPHITYAGMQSSVASQPNEECLAQLTSRPKINLTAYYPDKELMLIPKENIRAYAARIDGAKDTGVGITVKRSLVELKLDVTIGKTSMGRFCGIVSGVSGTYGFISPVQIMVAKEYQEGTCEYNETLEHELYHYKAIGMTIAQVKKIVEKDAKYIPYNIGIVYGASASAVKLAIDRKKYDIAENISSQLDRIDANYDAVIDSKENYKNTLARCENW